MFKTSTINHSYPRMHNILPNLWLGDIEASEDLESIGEHKITHIVSVLSEIIPVPTHNHLFIHLRDGEPYSDDDLAKGVKFIKQALIKNQGVLVHCMAGISRSTTMVAAYLMKEGMTPDKALNLIREKREIVDPAYFTFQSAIQWAYPNSELICKNCSKLWDYREMYEFINFIEPEFYSEYEAKQKNKKECACEKPEVIIKKNNLKKKKEKF